MGFSADGSLVMDALLQRLELPHGANDQVAPRDDQADGAAQGGDVALGGGQVIDRELTADEARAFMQRAFADISIRRMNQALIEKAEAAGTVVVTRHE